MQASITNSIFQTQLFAAIFLISLIFFWSKKNDLNFDNNLTVELKGFAMLAIVLSHIGYFLVSDHQFLFPLSVEAGVGVNLFLLLSGFGLTISQIKNPLKPLDFYRKRLPRLFIPLWIVITVLFLIDGFVLHKTYSLMEIVQSYLGFYPSSNIFGDLDSPLWYLTMILYFYLIFPIFFWPKKIWASIITIFSFAYILLNLPLPLDRGVQDLYQLHFLAFPLGILTAWIILKLNSFKSLNQVLQKLLARIVLTLVLFFAFCYFAINSGVGHGKSLEQLISIISTYLIVMVFWLKPLRFKLFNLIGKYSFEIYLLHWPIIYRYDHFFKFLPAGVAVAFYLIEFILLGIVVQKISAKISQKII